MTLSELLHEEARLQAKRKALVMPVEDSDWKPEGGACSGNILVTGGAGYIGSHTTLQLLVEGYSVVVVDNLNNSSEEALRRVSVLAGPNGANLSFFKVDLCNKSDLSRVFQTNKFDAVIHFAGYKAVGESVRNPLLYYQNNINSTLNLVELMAQHNCKKIVFSSSATVYGQPSTVPCTEDSQVQTLNPYARTKLFIEEILRDLQTSDPEWRVILLRYFNPVGAHPSGLIGEDPIGVPNNLMPFIQQVAVGRRPHLTVFGSDYETIDGTGVRDYIHVMDVATGHTAALTRMFATDTGVAVYNLGNGKGTSVLEMVAAFERASHVKIHLVFADRRPGDASEIYASTERASKELLWRGKYTIDDMCRDQWKWASSNPYGYQTPNENADCEKTEEKEHSNDATRELQQQQQQQQTHEPQSKAAKALKFMSPSLPIPSDLTPLMNITTNGLIRLEA